jgi:hypothetical protein
MVYHGCGIAKISPSQKSKLKRGEPVRMKLGSAHTLPMTDHQIKKLESAHRRGAAHTVHLDPYQIDELHGMGFFDTLKKVASNPITKSISRAVRPMATNMARGALTSLGPMGQALGNATIDILDKEAESRGYGLKKVGRPRKYVHHDKRIVEPVERGRKLKSVRGKGFFDNLKKVASSDVAKGLSKSLRPMATDFLRSKLPQGGVMGTLGNLALDEANKYAESKGYGVKKRRGPGRPRKGGALIAAGY